MESEPLKPMSIQSYQINNLYIMCSCTERAIYMKIMDKFTHTCYEGNTDPKEIRGLVGTISDIYRLINKCLSEETVEFSVNNGIMKCGFETCLESIFTLKFDILLREKILGQDGEVSLKIFDLEQQLRESREQIEKLEQRLIERENEMKQEIGRLTKYENEMKQEIEQIRHRNDIAMRIHAGLSVDPKNISTEITVESLNDNTKFAGFISNLKTLNINDYICRTMLKVGYDSMETINIHNSSSQRFDNNELLCLANKPNLKHIYIANCYDTLNMDGVRQFFDKMTCPLETIMIKNCNQIDKFALQTLCDAKGVKLNM